MTQKKKLITTLKEISMEIQKRFYINPLIAGLLLLFIFWQFISAIGFFLIAWSKSVEIDDNETGISVIGLGLVILGLLF